MRFRVGQGFDVHRFGGSGPLILGGVEIPSEVGLLAHSDGDVLLHALIDALLGGLGLGDIGHWFPDNDAKWHKASSVMMLKTVAREIQARAWRVVNADMTVICQRPKISPYRSQMIEVVAKALDIPITQVNIKGTTTEGLGFAGRGEGIAAQAVVLLEQQ